MGDLHALVACYLEDTFCCFFEEGVPLGPGEKAAQVAAQPSCAMHAVCCCRLSMRVRVSVALLSLV